jgi:hypothetical protein
VVQISDIVYTVRGEKTNHRTKDYSKGLIVGDQLKAAIEGNKLILLLPDGKNLDTSNPDEGTGKAVITSSIEGR